MGDNLYNRGEQLQLICSTEGGPELEYTWIFSGSIIPNANTSTLTINSVNITHAGDYTCNVTNDAGYQSNNITVYSKLLYYTVCVCVGVHALCVCMYVCVLVLSGIDILQTVRYLVYVNGPKKQHFELLKDGAKEELHI